MIKKIVHEFEVNMQLLTNTYSRSVAENFKQFKATFEERKWKKNKNDNIFIVKKPIYDQFKKKRIQSYQIKQANFIWEQSVNI